jgi:hypothetical protein
MPDGQILIPGLDGAGDRSIPLPDRGVFKLDVYSLTPREISVLLAICEFVVTHAHRFECPPTEHKLPDYRQVKKQLGEAGKASWASFSSSVREFK